MILPAARERLEALLRHRSMEGALAELRANAAVVSITGLHDVAKALVAVHLTHALPRPAFLLTDSNRRAEALAETRRFFATIFPGPSGSVATLPFFDRLPWESQSPHADILERRATTLFRLVDGQISLVIAPMAAALWRYQDPAAYLYLTKTLAKDTEIGHEELITHLGSVGYTRTEMAELPGQFAVRGGIIDVFSPEAPRPVRIELLGDTVESVREFDARTQRSIAPVVRTTLLPLTEWAVPASENGDPQGSVNWESAPRVWAFRRAGHGFSLRTGRELAAADGLSRRAANSRRSGAATPRGGDGNLRTPRPRQFTAGTSLFLERRADCGSAWEDVANSSGATCARQRLDAAIRNRFPPEYTVSRRCGRLHGRREVAAGCGRPRVSDRRQHRRDRTVCGHLPRVRSALCAG